MLYRGGDPGPLGLSSYTTNRRVAELYALRNGGPLYSVKVPREAYGLALKDANPQQNEYLVLGMPQVGPAESGDGPALTVHGHMTGGTPLVTPDQATQMWQSTRHP